MPGLGQKNLVSLLINGEIPWFGHTLARDRISLTLLTVQQWHHVIHGTVHFGVIFGLTTDDERRTGVVDEHRVGDEDVEGCDQRSDP